MKVKGKKLIIPIGVAIVLAITGTVLGLNGYFGGGSSIPSDTFTRGLVGYWSLDEGSGQTAFDATDNNNDGTLGTTTSSGSDDPKWTTGKVGGALQFDGSDDFVNLGATPLSSVTAGTISFWMKPDNFTADGGNWQEDGVFCKGAVYAAIVLPVVGGNNKIRYFYNDGVVRQFDSNFNFSTGEWYHIAYTWDSGGTELYIDGSVDATSALTFTNMASAGLTEDFIIGRNLTIAEHASLLYYDGLIDEVRIYNRALSAEEVRYHYNRGGPVAHWTFDEGNGTTTYDMTDNDNDGYFGSTTTSPTWVAGKYGTALSFDGTDDYVSIPIISGLSTTQTIEMWFKSASFSSGMNQYLMQEGTDVYAIQIYDGNNNNGLPTITFNNQLGTPAYELPIANTWYHLVAIWNGNGTGSVYINSVLVLSFTGTNPTPSTITMGQYAGGSYNFNGLIDDVRIYNYARTPDEIALDYNAGFAARFGPQSSCEEDPGSCMDYGLVGYWNLEEGGGTYAYDNSDYSNAGTLGGYAGATSSDPKWTTGIKPLSGGTSGGSALQFDGKDDYVDAGNDSSLDLTGEITIEAWVKLSGDTGTYQNAVRKEDAYLLFDVDVSYGWVSIYIKQATGWKETRFTQTPSWFQDSWHHVVGTFDGTYLKAYIDGQFDKQESHPGAIVTSVYELGIGCKGGVWEHCFDGLIDDVRIYNRALSAEEIRYHYNRGGPVAHWRFDEGNGTTTYDSSNNSNDGQFMTAASSPTWTTGKYGTALSFDGTDDYVSLVPNTSLEPSQFSIEAWVKGKGNGQIYVYYPKGAHADGRGVTISPTSISFGDADGSWAYVSRVSSHDSNTWTYITAVYDGSVMKLYVNGIFDNSATEGITWTDGAGPNPPSKTAVVGVGYNSGYQSYFNGLIDDVRIYNYARTPSQIQQDYNEGMAAHFGPIGEGIPTKDCDNDPAACMDYGLVGYLPFDEGSGSLAYDASENSNDGTLGTTTAVGSDDPRWATGIKPLSGGVSGGSALQFDGKDDYVDAGNNSSLDVHANNFSIELWAKFDDSGTVRYLLQKGSYATSLYQIRRLATNNLRIVVEDYSDANYDYYDTATTFPASSNWYHIVAVWTRSTGIWKVYINGVEDGQVTVSAGGTPSVNGTVSLRIGTENTVANPFNGLIDEVRIYNRALSAEEIRYHYNRGGPVAHWTFDEGDGQTAYDESNNSNDGTLTNGPTWVQGKYDSALSFDGVDDYVYIGANTSIKPAKAITVGAWVKTSQSTGVMAVYRYRLYGEAIYISGGKAEFDISPSSPPYPAVRDSVSISDGNWHYIVGTYDSSLASDNVKLYVEGVLRDTANETRDIYYGSGYAAIGRDGDYDGTYFNGLIDDVRIYNYARTPSQILQDYNAGLSAHFQ